MKSLQNIVIPFVIVMLMIAQASMFQTCRHAEADSNSSQTEEVHCQCDQQNNTQKRSDENSCDSKTCIFYFQYIYQPTVYTLYCCNQVENNSSHYNFHVPIPFIKNIDHPPEA